MSSIVVADPVIRRLVECARIVSASHISVPLGRRRPRRHAATREKRERSDGKTVTKELVRNEGSHRRSFLAGEAIQPWNNRGRRPSPHSHPTPTTRLQALPPRRGPCAPEVHDARCHEGYHTTDTRHSSESALPSSSDAIRYRSSQTPGDAPRAIPSLWPAE